MLQAYFDGSGTGDRRLFVLAGYIAPAEAWAKFSDDWQDMLDLNPKLPYFRMNQMAGSPERLERASWFYRIIERHVTAAVSCAINTDDLVKVARSLNWPPYVPGVRRMVENPYYLAVRGITNGLSQEQSKLGISEPVDFIFDEEAVKATAIEIMQWVKAVAPPDLQKLMGDTPIYRDDKKVLPLQAADLFAWWVRKWKLEGDPQKQRFPWRMETPIPYLRMSYSEKEIREEYEYIIRRGEERFLTYSVSWEEELS